MKDERKEWEDGLTDLASKAYERQHGLFEAEPFSVMFAPVRALRAVSFYISEKEYETKLPHLRKALKAAKTLSTEAPRETIKRFCHLVGTNSDAVPPFAQMRALYCYGDPRSNGLQSNEPNEIRRECEREDTWEASLSPAVLCGAHTGQDVLTEGLRQWLSLVGELSEMTGSGRSPKVAETNFVAELAHYWTHELRAVTGNSRAESYHPGRSQQQGLFANFVRLSAEMIPAEYNPPSWDDAIRRVLERSP